MDRRNEIIQACLKLIAEHGIKGLTQPRLANTVGIKQGHLTYYFPTRLHMLRAVAEAYMVHALDSLEMSIQSIEITIEVLIDSLAAQTCDLHMARFMLALTAMSEEDQNIRQLVHDFEEQLIDRLDSFIAAIPCPIPVKGETLHALILGLTIQNLSTGRNNMKAVATRVLKQVLIPSPEKGDTHAEKI